MKGFWNKFYVVMILGNSTMLYFGLVGHNGVATACALLGATIATGGWWANRSEV